MITTPIDVPKRRRRLTSAVWNDFEKIKKDGVDVALCKYCNKELSGSSSSGTTHLNNHLKRCSRNFNPESRQWIGVTSKLKRGDGGSVPSSSHRNFKYDEKRSRLELARMIIYHEYPFSIVEHVGFRRFVHSLCPSFNMISRDVIREDCMVLYENEKKRIYDMLERLPCRLSLTLDVWLSCHSTGFICLTVHYLDEKWILRKRILSFMIAEECQTGEIFANFLMKQITDWNVHHKLFSLTLDNECVNDVANVEIKNRLCQSKLLLSDGQFFHVQCAAYVINSIVQSVLEKSQKVIGNIREMIEFANLTQHQPLSDSIVQEFELMRQKGPHLDQPTNWNTTYNMIQASLEYKDVFIRFHSCVPEFTAMLSEEQWTEAATVCNCLKIFYDVTLLLSSTDHPTANLFFEEFCEIQLQLVEWLNAEDELVRSIASMMKEKFDKYWDKCNTTLAVASVLDPRYKMKLVECYYPQIYGDTSEHHIKQVVDTFKNLYEEYVARPIPISSDNSNIISNSSMANVEGSENLENTVNGSLTNDANSVGSKDKLRRFDRFLQENTQSQHLKTDVDEFLDEGVFPRDKDKSFSVWEWWRANAAKYPLLSKMARDVLAISISTATSDSAFSFGNRVIDAYRSSLSPDIIQALMCMQDWLRDEMGGKKINFMKCIIFSHLNKFLKLKSTSGQVRKP